MKYRDKKQGFKGENPFRGGTKLNKLFGFFLTRGSATLGECTRRWYGRSYITLERKRVASAIRTIRQIPGIEVNYHNGKYFMYDCRVDKNRPITNYAHEKADPKLLQLTHGQWVPV
jgi:hypothetical protein